MNASIRRRYVLARLNKDTSTLESYPNLVNDDELSSTNAILDVVEDLDITRYSVDDMGRPLTLARESLLGIIINIELVLRGARLCCLLDSITYELGQELGRRATTMGRNILPELYIMPHGSRYLIFLRSRAHDVVIATASREEEDDMLAVVLGHGYAKSYHPTHPTVIIDFLIDNKYRLYAFRCPVSEYTPQILEESIDKAKTFTDALSPLGFTITAELMYDEV